MVYQAVRVPVRVTVILHPFEADLGGRGGLLRGRWRWRRCFDGRFFWGLQDLLVRFGLAGRVVSWVAENWDRPCWQVHDLRLTEWVFGVAQVDDVCVGENWRGVLGGGGRRGLGGGGGGRGQSGRLDPQGVLVAGGVGAVGLLKVTHLLIQHPNLVYLIELVERERDRERDRERKRERER